MAVKCNLRAPVCSNCWKRDEVCDYQLEDDALRTQPHVESALGLVATRTFPGLYEAPFDDALSTRLMEHYLVRTSREFPPLADSDPMWRRDMIHASTVYPFLQHALMAVSGLHICRTEVANPRSYYHAACQHMIQASRLFRSSVTDLHLQNWMPVAAFIISSTMVNFDASFCAQRFENPSRAISPASILRILRGPRSLYHTVNPLVFSHPHAGVLIQRLRQHRFPLDGEAMSAIDELEVFCVVKSATTSGEACVMAVRSLRRWANFVSCQPRMWVHFFSWPAEVSDEYVAQLESDYGLANVIFVYWCAIMTRAPAMYYLTGTMDTLASRAIRHCDAELMGLLQWPCSQLARMTEDSMQLYRN